uniref:UDENN domain-containing protein n=1 Tax=Hyaloperonospora arabidopsidis (strain Emoy2) TaxID=559515 RepID=M4B478_HYAAE
MKNMGTDDSRKESEDSHGSQELEKLCFWIRHKDDPPLSNQESVGARRTWHNHSEDAYQYPKASQCYQRSMVIPASLSTTNSSSSLSIMGTPEREREKRRMSASIASNDDTPNKRQKDERFAMVMGLDVSEDEDEVTTQPSEEEKGRLSLANKCVIAQERLLHIADECVAARENVFTPEQMKELWKCFEVKVLPEMEKYVKDTMDALVRWVKDVEGQEDAQDIQRHGVVLTVEVVARLPPHSVDTDEMTDGLLMESALAAKDKEVAAIVQAENDVTASSAYARAKAAKHAIERLSSACKAYMDWLSQYTESDEVSGKEKAQVEAELEALGQRLAMFVTERIAEVEKAERALSEAKEKKETRSAQIVEFVRKQHQVLVSAGETEASASLQAVVDVWKQKDVEVQMLWSSRDESENRVEESARALLVAQHALAFHETLSVFFSKVREQREKALSTSRSSLEEARSRSEARAITALEAIIPMLTRALSRYCEFHAVQQSKANGEVEEQEKALAAHNEYFGDSAPIKKSDIEQRIREFIGVTQSSIRALMDIADGQQELWKNKNAVLSKSVRSVLMRQFEAFWLHLSRPIQDVMRKCLTTIEEIAGEDMAVEPRFVSNFQPATPGFATSDVLDEQMIPAFKVSTFPESHAEVVTPYQRAISAIVAPDQTAGSVVVQVIDKKCDSVDFSISNNNTLTESAMETRNDGVVAALVPQGSKAHNLRHRFAVGSVLYSKVNVGGDCAQFFRGIVLRQLDNDMYEMQYDNGEKFTVKSSYLYTKDPQPRNQTQSSDKKRFISYSSSLYELSRKRRRRRMAKDARTATGPYELVQCYIRSHATLYWSGLLSCVSTLQQRGRSCWRLMSVLSDSSDSSMQMIFVERAGAGKVRGTEMARKVFCGEATTTEDDEGSAGPCRALFLSTMVSCNMLLRRAGVVKIKGFLYHVLGTRSSYLDQTANLLSPTLSSFDFDDDSSEDGGDALDDDNDERRGILSSTSLVRRTRHASEVAVDGDEKQPDTTSDYNDPLNSSIDQKLRDKQSLVHHSDATTASTGRLHRSSTTGSAFEALEGRSSKRSMDGKKSDDAKHSQQQHLMHRITHVKPSSRDLWYARTHPKQVQNAVRSIKFSMQFKKEHMFERFFVTGMALTDTGQQHRSSDLAGYWKPKLLYDFPNRSMAPPDEFIADFCFPRGVPLTVCTPAQAASVRGMAVSEWFTEIESLLKHAPETTGYTFRLTGGKGESPLSSVASGLPGEGSGSPSGNENRMDRTTVVAPRCYCFTTKFPFYRFHFAVLRMIIENELEQHRISSTVCEDELEKEVREDEQFEIILRPLLDLAIEFSNSNEEHPLIEERPSSLEVPQQSNLTSIATKQSTSLADQRVVLSEDESVRVDEDDDSRSKAAPKRRTNRFRKSLSTDDIDSYYATKELMTNKLVAKTIGSRRPKEYEHVKVGDILEAVDSIATASMSFDQTMALLEKGNRPMRLRFRRPHSTVPSCVKRSKRRQYLSATSIDILHRAQRMRMNDPGYWSTTRFPTFDFSYQFPRRHPDRWTVGVVLRFLTPDNVVEIMAHLLLEKQVVIMSDDTAKVSAVCTAFVLLLSPFQWQSTYIPLLPSGLLDFLHSPVPFLVGCHSLTETSQWPDVCFYNIDRNHVAVPAMTRHLGPPSLPHGVELCHLLWKAKERFDALHPSGKPLYELSDEQDTIITLTLQEAEIFLRDLGFDLSSHDLAASISGEQLDS